MTGKQHLRGAGCPASPPALPARSHRPSKTPPPPLTPTRSPWPPRAASCPLHSKASDAVIDFKCIEPDGGPAAAAVAAAAAAAVDKARRNYSPVNHIPPGSTGHHSLLAPITLRAAQHLMQAAQQAKRRRHKDGSGSVGAGASGGGGKQRSQSHGRAHCNIYQPACAHCTSPSSPVPLERPLPPPPYPPQLHQAAVAAASSVPQLQPASSYQPAANAVSSATGDLAAPATTLVVSAAAASGSGSVATAAAQSSSGSSKGGGLKIKSKLCRLFHRGSSLSSIGAAGKPPTGQSQAASGAAAGAAAAVNSSEVDSLNNSVTCQTNGNSGPVVVAAAATSGASAASAAAAAANTFPPATPARRRPGGRDLSLDAGSRRISRQQQSSHQRHLRDQSSSAVGADLPASAAAAIATPSAFRRGRISPVHLRTAAPHAQPLPHAATSSTGQVQLRGVQPTPATPPTLPPRSARMAQSKFAINFLENLCQLKRKPWYFGPLSSAEADDMLKNRPDGTFLVRDSAHDSYIVSLSFRAHGQTYHTRIEHNKGMFSFWSQPENHSASTIVDFIESAVKYSKTGNFHYFVSSSTPGTPPIQVSMLYPLSRFSVMTSLQHRCRFEILARTRRDHIDCLPLPRTMREYLQEKQYFIECKEDFLCDGPPPGQQPQPPAQLEQQQQPELQPEQQAQRAPDQNMIQLDAQPPQQDQPEPLPPVQGNPSVQPQPQLQLDHQQLEQPLQLDHQQLEQPLQLDHQQLEQPLQLDQLDQQQEQPLIQLDQQQQEQPLMQLDQQQQEQPLIQLDQLHQEQPLIQLDQQQREQPLIQLDHQQREQPLIHIDQQQQEQPLIQLDHQQPEQPLIQLDHQQQEQPLIQLDQQQQGQPLLQLDQ